MTVTAFIMISVADDNNRRVLEHVQGLDETKEAYIIFGAFDIIVKAEFKDHQALSEYVVDKIRAVPGIGDTQTNVCASC